MNEDWKTFDEWVQNVPDVMKQDRLWEFLSYQQALFLSDLAWRDCELLQKHRLGKHLVNQLLRSAASVPANIEEGFSRGFGKDYAYFLRIALGSARETRGWYYRNRHCLPDSVIDHRMQHLTTLIKNLTLASNHQRKSSRLKTNSP